MIRRRYTYRARPAKREDDGKRYRILRTVEGPNSDLYPEHEQWVATLREDQARDLLESLRTQLEDKATPNE